jgi:hypothetical protein
MVLYYEEKEKEKIFWHKRNSLSTNTKKKRRNIDSVGNGLFTNIINS